MVIQFQAILLVSGHRLSAHILVIDYIWKTEVIFESVASSETISFQINVCR